MWALNLGAHDLVGIKYSPGDKKECYIIHSNSSCRPGWGKVEVAKALLTYHLPIWKSCCHQGCDVNNSIFVHRNKNRLWYIYKFKIFVSEHLLSTYYVHIVERWELWSLKRVRLLSCFLKSLLSCGVGRHRNSEIIQKNERKGMEKWWRVRQRMEVANIKSPILNISVTVHVAFISFAKGRIKILWSFFTRLLS